MGIDLRLMLVAAESLRTSHITMAKYRALPTRNAEKYSQLRGQYIVAHDVWTAVLAKFMEGYVDDEGTKD